MTTVIIDISGDCSVKSVSRTGLLIALQKRHACVTVRYVDILVVIVEVVTKHL